VKFGLSSVFIGSDIVLLCESREEGRTSEKAAAALARSSRERPGDRPHAYSNA
jgi:hypothetical protein